VWYRENRLVTAALEDALGTLLSRGTSEEVINTVRSKPVNEQGFFIGQLMKNPLLSFEELNQAVTGKLQPQIRPENLPTPFEISVIKMFEAPQQLWAQVTLRKLRARPVDSSNYIYYWFPGRTPEEQEWNIIHEFERISHWAKAMLEEDSRFQLNAYKTFDEATQESNEWHRMMAGLGNDKYYTPFKKDEHGNIVDERIVYTYADGWRVVNVLEENDLKVEGNRMNHCVGSYCRAVTDGKTNIYSLRDPRNQPKVTIEINNDNIIEQIKAHSDEVPEKDLRLRLAEWFAAKEPPVYFESGDDGWDGPDWEVNSGEDLRYNIYEEAYGNEMYSDEEIPGTGADYHRDYGVGGKPPDYSRNVLDLRIWQLLDSVEEAVKEDRVANSSTLHEAFDALVDVLIDHDIKLMNAVLNHDKDYFDKNYIYDYQTDSFNFDKLRNALGVFDIAGRYADVFQEYADDEELPTTISGNVDHEEMVDNSSQYMLYYRTLEEMFSRLVSTTRFSVMNELYRKLVNRNLVKDLVDASENKLPSAKERYEKSKNDPKLMTHKEDYPPGYFNGNYNEFDEHGWQYASRRRWYRKA
jgi:hypothetical protein